MADLGTLVDQPLPAVSDVYADTRPLLGQVNRHENDVAIGLLSQHMAAFEHVWYPVIEDRLGGEPATRRHRQWADRLWRRLRLLQRCLAGDGLTGQVDCASLLDRIRRDVERLGQLEQRQLSRLDPLLSAGERQALLDTWEAARSEAPTRPHPHLPHHGPAEPIAFKLAGWGDRVLDTLDARPVPRQRRSRARQPDLWTAYVLGQVPRQREPADPATTVRSVR